MKQLADVARDSLQLAPAQRLTLARILLELSDSDQDFSPDAEVAWEAEIGRRIQAVKDGTASTRTCEEVFADLDRRVAQ